MKLAEHYWDGGMRERVLSGLQKAGKDLERLQMADLAPFDEFHLRGLEASRELAARAAFAPDDRVLDIGSGIGGPARFLATELGCHVTGIDLTPSFTELATELSQMVGLADQTWFVTGDATEMPFEDAGFDGVWMQHVNMNIPAKDKLFAEALRVTKPGGRMALHEVVRRADSIAYPVPWADDPTQSFLATPDELQSAWEKAGWTTQELVDDSEKATTWISAVAERIAREGPPPLGLHLIFGERAGEVFANIRLNLQKGAIGVVMTVLEK